MDPLGPSSDFPPEQKEERSFSELLEYFFISTYFSEKTIDEQGSSINEMAGRIQTLDKTKLQGQNTREIISICKKHLITERGLSKEEVRSLIEKKIDDGFMIALEIAYMYGDSDLLEEFFGEVLFDNGINLFYRKEKNSFEIVIEATVEKNGHEDPSDPNDQLKYVSSFIKILNDKDLKINFSPSLKFAPDSISKAILSLSAYLQTLSLIHVPFWIPTIQEIKDLAETCKYLENLTVTFDQIHNFSFFNKHPHLTKLTFFDENREGFITIPTLPSKITSLACFLGKMPIILQFPTSFPDSIEKILLEGVPIDYPMNWPKNLKSFTLLNNPRIFNLGTLPDSLETLILYETPITQISSLPKNLKTLEMTSLFKLEKYPEFPETIETLVIENCFPSFLPEIPKSVKNFSFNDTSFPLKTEKKIGAIQKVFLSDWQKGLYLFDQFHLYDPTVRQEVAGLLLEKHGVEIFKDLSLLVRTLGKENLYKLTFFSLQKDFLFFLEHAEFLPLTTLSLEDWIKEENLKELFSKVLDLERASQYEEIEGKILDDLPEVKVEKILEMFDTVNFQDPKKPGYVVEKTRKDDDGTILKIYELKKGIEDLVSHIQNKDPAQGVPQKEAARAIFYLRVERLYKHVIALLKEEDDRLIVNNRLTDFAIAGRHCGTRWEADGNQAYRLLLGKFPTESFEDFILLSISHSIVGFIEETALDLSKHPELGKPYEQHVANYVCSVILPEVKKVSAKFPYEKEDSYTTFVGKHFPAPLVLKKFHEHVHLFRITKLIQMKINDLLGESNEMQEFVIASLIHYLEKNMEEFDSEIDKELKRLDQEIQIKQKEFGKKAIQKKMDDFPHVAEMVLEEVEGRSILEWMRKKKPEERQILRPLYNHVQQILNKEIEDLQKDNEKKIKELEAFFEETSEFIEHDPKQQKEFQQKLQNLRIKGEVLQEKENPYEEGTQESTFFEKIKEQYEPILKKMRKAAALELQIKTKDDLKQYKKLKSYIEEKKEGDIELEKRWLEEGREAGSKWLRAQKNLLIHDFIKKKELIKQDELEKITYLSLEGTKYLLKNFDLLTSPSIEKIEEEP